MADRDRIKVLIVDDIVDTRDNLAKLLLFERDIEVAGAAADGLQAIDMAGQLQPDVVLMDINMPGMDGISATEAIRSKWPETQVIIMSVHGDPEYLRRAMVAGAREFLIKPFSAEELTQSIRRVAKLVERRVIVQPVPPPREETAAVSTSPHARGRIVTVFSPKGGIGCTTIACNLAVALAANPTTRVALVDCSLQFADVGLFLNMQSNTTIVDLIPHIGSLDADVLDSVMSMHQSGVKVLLGPPRPEMAELVTADALKTILGKLREMYDFVVVDTWPSFQETMLTVLDASDNILTILALEIPAIKNVKLFLEIAEVLGYPSDKITLVLNRSDSNGGIEVGEVEKNLNRRIAASIVSDPRAVAHAVNRGVPLVIDAKDTKVAKGLLSLAEYVENKVSGNGSTSATASAGRKPAETSIGRVFGALRFGRGAEPRRA